MLNDFVYPYALFEHDKSYYRLYYFHGVAYYVDGQNGKRCKFRQNKRQRKTYAADENAVVYKCNKGFSSRAQRKITRVHKALKGEKTGRNHQHLARDGFRFGSGVVNARKQPCGA